MADRRAVGATTGTEVTGPLQVGSPPGGAPAFDAEHPPSAALVGDCVHCGFCLPSCPTYVLWGEEMDSPRGRIYLVGQGLEGEPMTPAMVQHIDACLGCMACLPACPSGVQYDRIVEATRAQIERRYDRPAGQRLLRRAVFSLFPYPRRLRLLRGPLRVYQRSGLAGRVRRSGLLERVSPRLAAMESLAPPLATGPDAAQVARFSPAVGVRRETVGLLLGCVQRAFFPAVNAATVRVLTAEGFDVVAAREQGCCGALSVHNGRADEARRFARALIDAFDASGVQAVVVNVAGCGSAMKNYAELLADDPGYAERARQFGARVRDVTELLAERGTVAERHPLPTTVAYHDACHLASAQGVRAAPRALLSEIPDLEVREIADPDLCCGSAGIYNVLFPDTARELGDRKAAAVLATGAPLVATGNPGCLMQIAAAARRRGTELAVAHTVEVLDASIRARPVTELIPAPSPAPDPAPHANKESP